MQIARFNNTEEQCDCFRTVCMYNEVALRSTARYCCICGGSSSITDSLVKEKQEQHEEPNKIHKSVLVSRKSWDLDVSALLSLDKVYAVVYGQAAEENNF